MHVQRGKPLVIISEDEVADELIVSLFETNPAMYPVIVFELVRHICQAMKVSENQLWRAIDEERVHQSAH